MRQYVAHSFWWQLKKIPPPGNKIYLLNKHGFSLVEVVVTTVLLALIATGIFTIALSSQKIVDRSHVRHAAMEVAQALTEDLRVYLGADQWYDPTSFINPDNPLFSSGGWSPWQSLAAPISFSPQPTQFCTSELAIRYNGRWRYQILNVSGYDYRKANVEVAWDESQ